MVSKVAGEEMKRWTGVAGSRCQTLVIYQLDVLIRSTDSRTSDTLDASD